MLNVNIANEWPLRSVSYGKFSLPLLCELTIDCVHSILLHLRMLGASCTYGICKKKKMVFDTNIGVIVYPACLLVCTRVYVA